AQYHCPNEPADCGWTIRLTAVQLLDKRIAMEAAALDAARHDAAFKVRLTALEQLDCDAMLAAFADKSEVPVVRLELMKSARANVRSISNVCGRTPEVQRLLQPIAAALGAGGRDWHEPA